MKYTFTLCMKSEFETCKCNESLKIIQMFDQKPFTIFAVQEDCLYSVCHQDGEQCCSVTAQHCGNQEEMKWNSYIQLN